MNNQPNINQKELEVIIEKHWLANENKELDIHNVELIESIQTIINSLDSGQLRIAQEEEGSWKTNQWLKKAILLSFKIKENKILQLKANDCTLTWYDKVDLKTQDWTQENFQNSNIRSVPGAYIRKGSYIGPNCVVMPSFINIGAYIDQGTMVDIWATIGSCAQIGKNCHISGNACIGGVLEPINNNPVIIEDNCFIGGGSQIVEGVIVEKGSIISSGVTISSSTKIVDRETGEITYGLIPAESVVVPGTITSKSNPSIGLSAAIIVKKKDAKAEGKTAINSFLRDIE